MPLQYCTENNNIHVINERSKTGIFIHSGLAEDSDSVQKPPIYYVRYVFNQAIVLHSNEYVTCTILG